MFNFKCILLHAYVVVSRNIETINYRITLRSGYQTCVRAGKSESTIQGAQVSYYLGYDAFHSTASTI